MQQISVPLEWVESISRLRMPQSADMRMRHLVRTKRESPLSEREQAELDALLQLNDIFIRLSVEAQNSLNRDGPNANQVKIEIRDGLPVMIPPPGSPPIESDAVRRFWQEEGI